jgi:LacI family transcriptional regulator
LATIKDVAVRAGVSIATVSRVLNNKGSCSQETAKRVRTAVLELEYTVNRTAKSLKTGLTGTIGVVVREACLLGSPGIIGSSLHTFQEDGVAVEVILNADMKNCVTLLSEGKYDGLLLVDTPRDESSLGKLIQAGGNIVFLGGDLEREDVNLVQIDYFGGGYQATKELINFGHNQILFLEDNPDQNFTREIKRGYLFALDENGIQYKEELLFRNRDVSIEMETLGYGAVKTFAEGSSFSAILSTDDRIACGALCAAREYSLRVPEELSIIGFGDRAGSKYLTPPLSTVRLPNSQMAELGAEILINNIRKRDGIVKRVALQTQLVRRNTIAKKA